MAQSDTRPAPAGTAPSEMTAAGWLEAAKAAFAKAGDDNVTLIASGIAFNAFLAFVPLLSAVVLTYGLVASPEVVAGHIASLSTALPRDAASLIAGQLESLVESSGTATGLGLVVTLAITLYGAMRGASGIIVGLNIAYDIEDSRPFLRQAGVALAITAAAILVLILASVAISAMSLASSLVPSLGGAGPALVQILSWAAAAAGVSLAIALTYRHAPNRPDVPWRWLTPGSVVATIVWIAATLAFSFYVRNFGSYNATYGALGAIVILLTWLYLSAYILLYGAELNQALEEQARTG